MKKILSIIILGLFCAMTAVFAQDSVTLKANVSIVDRVPKSLFGTWRVYSRLTETTDFKSFQPCSVDLWNLSKTENVITLKNPLTGAYSSINLTSAEYNKIVFTRIETQKGIRLTDKVELKIIQNEFKGYNEILIETPNKPIKKAKYLLIGKKIAGASIKED